MEIPLGYNGVKYTPQYAKIQANFNKNIAKTLEKMNFCNYASGQKDSKMEKTKLINEQNAQYFLNPHTKCGEFYVVELGDTQKNIPVEYSIVYDNGQKRDKWYIQQNPVRANHCVLDSVNKTIEKLRPTLRELKLEPVAYVQSTICAKHKPYEVEFRVLMSYKFILRDTNTDKLITTPGYVQNMQISPSYITKFYVHNDLSRPDNLRACIKALRQMRQK